ncbi:MAG: hypothetical protein NVSMB9_13840 [Isosphaeraceae bacterium]
MTANPLKFRCYRCQQLLGVSRSKAGAVVACPKCSAELLVPEPPEAVPVETGVSQEKPDTGLSLDFLDIRPEDIRVEPGFAPARPDPETNRTDRREGGTSSDLAGAPVAGLDPSGEGNRTGSTLPSSPLPGASERTTPSFPVETREPTLPPIQLDGPTTTGRSRPRVDPRAHDLILPRSVVASWSLLVLLAVVFAFVAGLLAGHHVWRFH